MESPSCTRTPALHNLCRCSARPSQNGKRFVSNLLWIKRWAFLLCMIVSAEEKTAEIVVYGGTSGGVMAAVQAARMDRSVILVTSNGRLGGMTASGLGQTDLGKFEVIGGLNAEFYQRIYKHYDNADSWFCETRDVWKNKKTWGPRIIGKMMLKFEPHVAEAAFEEFVAEHKKIELLRNERLDRSIKVKKSGAAIDYIQMESGLRLSAKIYLDCSYEGDLMAAADVSYAVGRESNDTYGETHNGIQLKSKYQHHKVVPGISAYWEKGKPESGLLPGLEPGPPGKTGESDHRIQAYCFRLCLTDYPENRTPFPKPEGYDRKNYELLRRTLARGRHTNLGNSQPMPNRKTDTNNHGGVSSDYIGQNYRWPEAGYEEREQIYQTHKRYQVGMWYFLTQDPQTPEAIRKRYENWGLTKDEFKQTGGWPHELYIREARRMIGPVVMTEHHCNGTTKVEDGIAHGGFAMDSHNCTRYASKTGYVYNEGDMSVPSATYRISYRSITPKAEECSNLLVPVCLSASHIAYGSIRMEPVFMSLGQSAGAAASLALRDGVSVQELDYNTLWEQLKKNGQLK